MVCGLLLRMNIGGIAGLATVIEDTIMNDYRWRTGVMKIPVLTCGVVIRHKSVEEKPEQQAGTHAHADLAIPE